MKDSPFLQRRYYRKFAERWDAVFGRFGLNSRNSTFIIFSASSHCRSSFSSIRELSHQCKLAQGPARWRNLLTRVVALETKFHRVMNSFTPSVSFRRE